MWGQVDFFLRMKSVKSKDCKDTVSLLKTVMQN